MKILKCSLLLFVWTTSTCSAFTVDRRTALQSLAAAAGVTTLVPVVVEPAEAVLSSKYCASGVGEGCSDLSEGNEFIRSLQEKSAVNRERNEKASRKLLSKVRICFDQVFPQVTSGHKIGEQR